MIKQAAICLLLTISLTSVSYAELNDSTEALFYRVNSITLQIAVLTQDIIDAREAISDNWVVDELLDNAFEFADASMYACIHIICYGEGPASYFSCEGLSRATNRSECCRTSFNTWMAETDNAYLLQQAMEIKRLMDQTEALIAPHRPTDCTDTWNDEDNDG